MAERRRSLESDQPFEAGDLVVLTKYVNGLRPGIGGIILEANDAVAGIPWLVMRYEQALPLWVLPDEVRHASEAEVFQSPHWSVPPPLDVHLGELRSVADTVGMTEEEVAGKRGAASFEDLSGRAVASLIDELYEHPYFHLKPPHPDPTMIRRLREFAECAGLSERQAAGLVDAARFRDLISGRYGNASRLLTLLYQRTTPDNNPFRQP